MNSQILLVFLLCLGISVAELEVPCGCKDQDEDACWHTRQIFTVDPGVCDVNTCDKCCATCFSLPNRRESSEIPCGCYDENEHLCKEVIDMFKFNPDVCKTGDTCNQCCATCYSLRYNDGRLI